MSMQTIKKAVLALTILSILLIVILVGIFWTPDTQFDAMARKYAGGASQFVDLGSSGRVHYRDQGVADAPALILIHGTSASLHTWEPLISQLEGRYRLVSLDLPGHGLTGENPNRDYSRPMMVSTIWRLMDHLNISSASLVGNSLGGAVAWASALDQADRVRSMVLLAPSGAPRTVVAKSNIGFKLLKTSVGQLLMKKVAPRSIIKSSLNQSVARQDVVTEKMVDRYWQLLRLKGNRQAMIDLANTPRDQNAWKRLSTIQAPTLVIWGEDDGLLPIKMLSTFENELKQVTSVRLPSIGHLPMEEDVDEVAKQIIKFCDLNNC